MARPKAHTLPAKYEAGDEPVPEAQAAEDIHAEPCSSAPEIGNTIRLKSVQTFMAGCPNGARSLQHPRFTLELDKENKWIVAQEQCSPFRYLIPLTNVAYMQPMD